MELTELKAALDAQHAAVTASLSDGKAALAELKARLDDIETKANRPRFGGGDGGERELKAAREDLTRFAKTGRAPEQKDMSVGSGPDGGYTVDKVMSDSIRARIAEISPIRSIARTVTITSGDSYEDIQVGELAAAEWVGEKSSRPTTASPSLQAVTVPLHEIYCAPVVTQKLLDLSSYDIAMMLEELIASAFAKTEGAAYVAGNGVAKARGFLTMDLSTADDDLRPWNVLQTVNSGAATSVTGDGLKLLKSKLKPAYRPNTSWLMNRNTHYVISTLKDGQGRYLLNEALAAGEPDTLLGHRVTLAEDMPDLGAGSLSVAFGDFKAGYLVLDWSTMKILRDPFTAKPNVIFYTYRRTGGGVLDHDAIKVLTTAS